MQFEDIYQKYSDNNYSTSCTSFNFLEPMYNRRKIHKPCGNRSSSVYTIYARYTYPYIYYLTYP